MDLENSVSHQKVLRIDSFKKTDVGMVRKTNQDFAKFGALYDGVSAYGIVCDGIGSSKNGGIAARLAVESLSEFIENQLTPSFFSAYPDSADNVGIRGIFLRGFEHANTLLYGRSNLESDGAKFGTTAVFALIRNGFLHVMNVGDSRCYIISRNAINQVTTDHSLVRKLIDLGEITTEESKNYPQKNVITRALGIEENVKPDYFHHSLSDIDGVLLCSDGLTNHVPDQKIHELFLNSEPEDFCDNLVNCANENGGTDNITVLFMHIHE